MNMFQVQIYGNCVSIVLCFTAYRKKIENGQA